MPSSWICVDASCVVRLLTAPEDEDIVAAWREATAQNRLFAAPTLLLYEISSALDRYEYGGVIAADMVDEALNAAWKLPVRLFGDEQLHRDAVELARQLAQAATYDAHYLALARRLDGEFWTADRRLFNHVGNRLAAKRLFS